MQLESNKVKKWKMSHELANWMKMIRFTRDKKKVDMNLHFYSIVIILHGERYAEKKIMFPTNWKHEPKWMIYHMSFDSSTKPFG